MTIWGETGVPEPEPAYPRPLLQRDGSTWASLNGVWQLDRTPKSFDDPPFGVDLPEEILVPFPIESPLSGVRNLTDHDYAWYRTVVGRGRLQPLGTEGLRTVLHFEASDYNTTVFVNGEYMGWHSGGYDPFDFDVTDVLGSDYSCVATDFPNDLS